LEVARPPWVLVVEVWNRDAATGELLQQCLGEARLSGAEVIGLLSELPKPKLVAPLNPTAGPSTTVRLELRPRAAATQVERNRSHGSVQLKLWPPPSWAVDDGGADEADRQPADEADDILSMITDDSTITTKRTAADAEPPRVRPGTREALLAASQATELAAAARAQGGFDDQSEALSTLASGDVLGFGGSIDGVSLGFGGNIDRVSLNGSLYAADESIHAAPTPRQISDLRM